jgi:hypothetical protein
MPELVESHAHLTWPISVERVVNAVRTPPEKHPLVTAQNVSHVRWQFCRATAANTDVPSVLRQTRSYGVLISVIVGLQMTVDLRVF